MLEGELDLSRQSNYRFTQKISGSKKRIQELVKPNVFKKLEEYEIALINKGLSEAAQAKNFDMILSLTRMIPNGKSWMALKQKDIDGIVATFMRKFSDNGKETATTTDHKRFLRIWYRFIKLGSREFKKVGDPIETRDLIAGRVEDKISRLQLITPEEKKKLVDSCTNLRDKALIDVHYDSGCRIGETLSLYIKHVKFDKYGAILSVDGKTGARNVRVLESTPTLATWIKSHPDKDNPQAPLFPTLHKGWLGEPLSYQASARVLKTACKKGGVRELYWHLFRHTEATRTAKYMPEALTKKRHGWSGTSKMAARYSHINDSDVDEVFLREHGINPDDNYEKSTVPVLCPICKTPNSYDSEICEICGKPLTMDKAILLDSQRDEEFNKMKDALVVSVMQQVEEQMLKTQAKDIATHKVFTRVCGQ